MNFYEMYTDNITDALHDDPDTIIGSVQLKRKKYHRRKFCPETATASAYFNVSVQPLHGNGYTWRYQLAGQTRQQILSDVTQAYALEDCLIDVSEAVEFDASRFRHTIPSLSASLPNKKELPKPARFDDAVPAPPAPVKRQPTTDVVTKAAEIIETKATNAPKIDAVHKRAETIAEYNSRGKSEPLFGQISYKQNARTFTYYNPAIDHVMYHNLDYAAVPSFITHRVELYAPKVCDSPQVVAYFESATDAKQFLRDLKRRDPNLGAVAYIVHIKSGREIATAGYHSYQNNWPTFSFVGGCRGNYSPTCKPNIAGHYYPLE